MSDAIDKLDTAKTSSAGALFLRVISALALMPLVIAAIHFGAGAFAGMIAFACTVMLFEWARMVERRAFSRSFYALAIGAAGATYLASAGYYAGALALAVICGAVSAFLEKRRGGVGIWLAFAALYIIIPCISLIWIRLDATNARALTFLLFGAVWAADTGAFIFGKFIGGPKVSYALSPSKTWAGIGGGVLGGSLVGAGIGVWQFGAESFVTYFLVGGGLGAASVIGDLAESGFKRNFGLKDISGFIPGHGGALDRLDGMIFATSTMTFGILAYMLFADIPG